MRKKGVSPCGGTTPVGATCRVKRSDKPSSEGDSTSQVQQVVCSTEGLLCLNSNQTGNTTCEDYEIQFECDAGGSECVNIDMCAEEMCKNGATCSDNSGKEGVYECRCVPGYTGYNCQHNVDECANSPCQNGATCIDKVNGYQCTCRPGYTGVLCNVDINECESNPCDPDTTKTKECIHRIDFYECVCKPGYTGINCSDDYDEVSVSHVYTVVIVRTYMMNSSCNCTEGWTGKRCDSIISYCSSDPCLNGATCHDVFTDYFCQCGTGYDGRNCEKGPDLCTVANPCQNGGTCHVEGGKAKCNCTQRFTGVTCETNKNDCFRKDCHEGTCIDGVEDAFCLCPVGKAGSACDKDIERDVDLQFDGRGGAYSLHPFPVNASSSSIGVWVRYADRGSTGTFLSMHMVKSQTTAHVMRTVVSLNETGVEMSFKDDVSLTYPLDTDINDGNWHYVALRLEDNEFTLYLDSLTGSSAYFTPVEPDYVVLHVGGSESERFRGALSLVQAWDIARNSTEVSSVFIAKKTPVTSPSYTRGLTADWGWDSFQPAQGMTRMSPSKRGQTICPSGQQLDTDGSKCVNKLTDKFPPTATCPSQDVVRVAEQRLAEVNFTKEPTFEGQHKVAKNHKSGDVFHIGVSPVVYSASDLTDNRAVCHFKVFLRLGDCRTPEPPIGGKTLDCVNVYNLIYKRCSVECDSGKAFLRPVPKFYSCGPIGVWNTNSPMNRFKFPPCGGPMYIREMLFPDDTALISHTEEGTQRLIDKLAQACVEWGRIISLKKTNVLGQEVSEAPAISTDDHTLEMVQEFTYLESTITGNLSFNVEINKRNGETVSVMSRLFKRVWAHSMLSENAKQIATTGDGCVDCYEEGRRKKKLNVDGEERASERKAIEGRNYLSMSWSLYDSKSGIVSKHLRFGWDFDLDADFTADNATTMKTQLRQKFVDWSKELEKLQSASPFCVTANCSDVSITVTDNKEDYRIHIDIDGVAQVSLLCL
ncbi:hypothetical protein LSAT2_027365 [Lamellibrachia satsuma]|nr:hypothetical protein LSAT2_027365 [Lamellibrachia satsuma]